MAKVAIGVGVSQLKVDTKVENPSKLHEYEGIQSQVHSGEISV